MPLLETSKGTLFYAESSPPPLILIHGSASSHLGWPAELRRFPNRRVLTIDLPGHGRATGSAHTTISAYADSVLALMQALLVPKAVLVGHSMGGAIALHMGLHMQEHVSGLVLIGSGAFLPVSRFILDNILSNKQVVIEKINQWSWAKAADASMQVLGLKALQEVPAETIHADYSACNQFDLRDRLPEIQVPALVIGGTADKMTPLAYSELLAERLPRATLKIVEGGGHWMMLEHPSVVAGYVAEWFNTYEN
ncbi:MAG: alpha/beta hydrolase [Anaerolineae bacterium]|nr:MAG: alpha/beta hydrolase [Anaerolineae bacterium]